MKKKDLNLQAFVSLAALLLVMAALLFPLAGSLGYWQAWVFLAVYGASTTAIILYLAKSDRALLDRRMKGGPFAEKGATQKIVMTIASLGFIGLLVIPALDQRYHGSAVPVPFVILGDLLILLGLWFVYLVFKVNTYTASTIQLARGQKVITTGPYALLRHPMYGGSLFYVVGIPIALGSWWGLTAIAFMLPALIWRLLDEEQFLRKNLKGYSNYCRKVRYRLIPGVW